MAGLLATLAGGWLADALRRRFPGSYFLVSGVGMLLAFPLMLAVLVTPFPWAYGVIFLTVFCLFFNTGPVNTIIANVTHPAVRASAFALVILIIHLFGDTFLANDHGPDRRPGQERGRGGGPAVVVDKALTKHSGNGL